MQVVIIAVALAVFLYALYAAPAFRTLGLGIAAGFCIVLGAYLVWSETRAVDPAATAIAPDELILDQLDLRRIGRSATLSGRVLNGSPSLRLRDLTITLRLHDCPDEAVEVATCPTIGEATATARPDTPPGQIRGFTALFAFQNVPPVTGTLRWDWEIAGTRATP